MAPLQAKLEQHGEACTRSTICQVIDNVLQKPHTSLESYYDFWEHMEHAGHATYFFTFLAQKLLAADKSAQAALCICMSIYIRCIYTRPSGRARTSHMCNGRAGARA